MGREMVAAVKAMPVAVIKVAAVEATLCSGGSAASFLVFDFRLTVG